MKSIIILLYLILFSSNHLCIGQESDNISLSKWGIVEGSKYHQLRLIDRNKFYDYFDNDLVNRLAQKVRKYEFDVTDIGTRAEIFECKEEIKTIKKKFKEACGDNCSDKAFEEYWKEATKYCFLFSKSMVPKLYFMFDNYDKQVFTLKDVRVRLFARTKGQGSESNGYWLNKEVGRESIVVDVENLDSTQTFPFNTPYKIDSEAFVLELYVFSKLYWNGRFDQQTSLIQFYFDFQKNGAGETVEVSSEIFVLDF